MTRLRGPNLRIEYECNLCGAAGVKLWRAYQTFLNHQVLRCFLCAVKEEKPTYEQLRRSDQIGSLVPAALTAEGDTFWGYSSVPDDRVAWWNALPLVAP